MATGKSTSPHSTRQMSFYEMSLLNTEFELDEVREQVELLCKDKSMIDTNLNRIKLERELDLKCKRLKKILMLTYKTGDYSPSKYGLTPTTPVKQCNSLTLTKNVVTSPKMVKKVVAQAPKRYEWSPNAKTDKRLLPGEDDDDMLLLADQGGSCESISFREAMDLVDGNGNGNKILVKGMEEKIRCKDVFYSQNALLSHVAECHQDLFATKK